MIYFLRTTLVVLSSVLLLACALDAEDDGEAFFPGSTMLPGDNCRSCHGGPATRYPQAPNWTVAGTVFEGPDSDVGAPGVTVHIEDETGTVLDLITNAVGNFYTPGALSGAYSVSLERNGVRVTMPMTPPSGGCNACHTQPAVGDAPGRLYLPDDGSYPSAASCEGSTLSFPTQTYDCAPYVCAAATAASPAQCRFDCTGDTDCSQGTCQNGRCSAASP